METALAGAGQGAFTWLVCSVLGVEHASGLKEMDPTWCLMLTAGAGCLPWTACLEGQREPEQSEVSWRLGRSILLIGPFVTLTGKASLQLRMEGRRVRGAFSAPFSSASCTSWPPCPLPVLRIGLQACREESRPQLQRLPLRGLCSCPGVLIVERDAGVGGPSLTWVQPGTRAWWGG